MMEEKLGRLADIIYFNDANCYTVAVFETENEQFSAVGYMPAPSKGKRYELSGEWGVHPRYGEQFAFSSFKEVEPTTEDGIAAFLASGVFKGVGPVTAEAIVKKFGSEALKIIQNEPDKLTEVPGIGKMRAASIAESYAQHREFAQTVIELSAYDISAASCTKLYKAYGANAPEIVRENPYRLISDIYGIGFRKADKIAEKLGFEREHPQRIKSGFLYYLESLAGEGNSYAPRDEFVEHCAQFLDVTRSDVAEVIIDLVIDGSIFLEDLDGSQIVQLSRYNRAERKVAERISALAGAHIAPLPVDLELSIAASEADSGHQLSELQKRAVASCLDSGVFVITGGPGTGKTTIIRAILYILNSAGLKTALAAPTGRAAKRMSEATGEDASTVHRLLEYSYSETAEQMRFGRNLENPLDFDCIIIDEMSMVDILLMEGLLDAVKPGTRLILVGDADQLPSVGAGNVLRDIIDSETVNSVRLKEVFRQACESMIVVNAHLINRGEYPACNESDTDFFFLNRASQTDIRDTIRDLLARRLPSYYTDIDPLDIQVLTPTKKGMLGSVQLNRMLQELLNPPAPGKKEKNFGERLYREGDKVMQNKNDYMLSWRSLEDMSEGEGVFNGDLGIIHSIDLENGEISVLFDAYRLATYDFSNIEEIEPAYAMTVHKSQGSEFPVVVMPMSRFATMLSTRNLLYTAVTRAVEGVVMVGLPEAMHAMVDNNSIVERYSALSHRLRAIRDFLNE